MGNARASHAHPGGECRRDAEMGSTAHYVKVSSMALPPARRMSAKLAIWPYTGADNNLNTGGGGQRIQGSVTNRRSCEVSGSDTAALLSVRGKQTVSVSLQRIPLNFPRSKGVHVPRKE